MRLPAMRLPAMRLLPVMLTFAAALVSAPAAVAGVANAGLAGASRSNPLAGMRWGHYTGSGDGVYAAYAHASGNTQRLLGQIALRPSAHWFGAWIPDGQAGNDVRSYIRNVTGGDSSVGAQIAVFRLAPWEGTACSVVPSTGQQAGYRAWIDRLAGGIGGSRTVIVLQPDLPFALCSPGRNRWLGMVAYAAEHLTALSHTTVYIDAGAYQWYSPSATATMLEQAGIRHVRGFSLNDTQYDSTSREIGWGAEIISRLNTTGAPGKHFLVNTSMNGAGFLNGQYRGDVANARVCSSPHDALCASLGIPPTTDVASPRWHLGAHTRDLAGRFVDAYAWVGRPWLVDQGGPFDLGRALGLVRSSPF